MSIACACLRRLFLLLVACASLNAVDASACSATTPDVFIVGNKATDSDCNFSTINDAVKAATCPAGTKIYLTDEVGYTGLQVITDRNVSLIGRASGAKCGSLSAVCGTFFPCPTGPLQTIHGTLKIRGSSNVTIQYLEITDGLGDADDNGNTHGGGIDYAATGRLDVYASTIDYNQAHDGGGIRFQGYNGQADLYLHSYTLIDFNEATNGGSGGGIRLEGTATLHADEPHTLIWQNTATGGGGKGGGILVQSPATAHIGSTGDVFFGAPVGVIWANQAQYGGGIAIVGSDVHTGESTEGHVTLAASDLHYPVRIEGNTATHAGGGIYLEPYVFAAFPAGPGGVNFVAFNASGYRIDGNSAVQGSAIYVDTATAVGQDYYGGIVNLTRATCLPLIECDIIDGNINEDGVDPPSTVLVQTSGMFQATGVRMSGNHGGAHLVREVGATSVVFDTCVLSGNHDFSGALLDADSDGQLTFRQCTIAANTFTGSHVIDSPGYSFLEESLIDQPGKGAYNGSLDHVYARNVVATDTAGLPADPTIEQQQPLFVDAANGDFRLLVVRTGNGTLLASQGVDFGAAGKAGDIDIDGRPFDRDIIGVGTAGNVRDLGAYEMQPISDRVFASGLGDPVTMAY